VSLSTAGPRKIFMETGPGTAASFFLIRKKPATSMRPSIYLSISSFEPIIYSGKLLGQARDTHDSVNPTAPPAWEHFTAVSQLFITYYRTSTTAFSSCPAVAARQWHAPPPLHPPLLRSPSPDGARRRAGEANLTGSTPLGSVAGP
jgi:hypothetical protein